MGIEKKELAVRIAAKRKLSVLYVEKLISGKLLTIQQVVDLTGLSAGAVHSKTTKRVRSTQPKLSYRYPFPHKGGQGPSFIINDKECLRLIEQQNYED